MRKKSENKYTQYLIESKESKNKKIKVYYAIFVVKQQCFRKHTKIKDCQKQINVGTTLTPLQGHLKPYSHRHFCLKTLTRVLT